MFLFLSLFVVLTRLIYSIFIIIFLRFSIFSFSFLSSFDAEGYKKNSVIHSFSHTQKSIWWVWIVPRWNKGYGQLSKLEKSYVFFFPPSICLSLFGLVWLIQNSLNDLRSLNDSLEDHQPNKTLLKNYFVPFAVAFYSPHHFHLRFTRKSKINNTFSPCFIIHSFPPPIPSISFVTPLPLHQPS